MNTISQKVQFVMNKRMVTNPVKIIFWEKLKIENKLLKIPKSIKIPEIVVCQLIYKQIDIAHKLKTGLVTISTQPLPYQFHILDKIFQFPPQ